jgi:hypothetical protein
MEIRYPYFTVIGLILGLIALVSIGWFLDRQSDRRFGMFLAGLLVALGGFFGIRDNIIEVDRLQQWATKSDQAKEAEITKQRQKIVDLSHYQESLESLVPAAIGMTAASCDNTCQTYVQNLVVGLPDSFPPDLITPNCKAPSGLRTAVEPLLTGGKIAAGLSPAIDAVINCVNKTQPSSAR